MLRLGLERKLRIAQAKAEGIEHLLLTEGLKVAVAHVDILHVGVGRLSAKVIAARIGLVAFGNGVGQPAAGRNLAGQHIGQRIAALHAALPGVDDGADLVCERPGPAHIDDVAAVQNHTDLFKVRGHQLQHFGFQIRQIVAALFQQILAVLAGRAANHHQRHRTVLRRLRHDLLRQRHLGVAHGPLSPRALIRHVAGLMAPRLVLCGELLLQLDRMGAQTVHQAGLVGRNDVAAAAVADGKIIHGHAAKHRDRVLRAKGQQLALVLEQHNALCGHFSGDRNNLRDRKLPTARNSLVQLLLQAGFFHLNLFIDRTYRFHKKQHLSVGV